MKDCEKIHPSLPLYAEGQLSGPDQARVAAHLKACARARMELEGFSRLAQSLRGLPEPEFPEGLHERIMARIAGRENPRSLFGRFWLPGSFGLAAVAAVAVLLFIQSPDLLKGPSNLAPSAPREEASSGRPPSPMKKEALTSKNPSSGQNPGVNANFALEEPPVKTSGIKPGASSTRPKVLRAAQKALRAGGESKNFGNPGVATDVLSQEAGSAAQTARPQNRPAGARVESSGMPAAQAPPMALPFHAGGITSPNTLSSVGPSRPLSTWSGWNGPAGKNREVLANAEAFGRKWRTLMPGRPLPELDFTRQAVILLEAGVEPNPGYSIHVTGLGEKDGRLEVHYRVEAPPAGAVEAQVLSRPWCMRVIPRPEKPVVFVRDP